MSLISLPKIINSVFLSWQSLKEAFGESINPLHVKVLVALNFLINAVMWKLAHYVNSIASQNLVYLHYNVDFGVNFIGSVKWFYVMPGLGLLVVILNLFSLIALQKEGKFISYLLLLSALIANGFLLLAGALLYFINFR